MLCEKCGKNSATTHIRTVVGGIVRETNLCSDCAAQVGYAGMSQNNLAQLLASMFGDALAIGKANTKKHCSCCSSTFSDIAHNGKVGCAKCYETFYDELLPYLKRVHGSTKHIGRIPNRAPLTVLPDKNSVEALRMKLSSLVSEEKFEEAAIVRDKIRELEAEN